MSSRVMGDESMKGGLVDISGLEFKLDLRDECTATAKLEKLKARYQKAAATGNKAPSTKYGKTGFWAQHERQLRPH